MATIKKALNVKLTKLSAFFKQSEAYEFYVCAVSHILKSLKCCGYYVCVRIVHEAVCYVQAKHADYKDMMKNVAKL